MKFLHLQTLLSAAIIFTSHLTGANADSSIRGNNDDNHRILKNDEELLFYIKAIEYNHDANGNSRLRNLQGQSGNNKGPDRTLNVGTDDGQFYEIKNSQGNGWAKGLVSGFDRIRIPPGSIMSDDGTIDLRGNKPDVVPGKNKALFDRNLRDDERTPEQERNLGDLRRHLVTIGDKTVLAVRAVGKNNDSYSNTAAVLSDKVFGTNGDPMNLKSQYTACSYGQLNFSPMADTAMANDPGNGITSDIVDGVVTVKVDVKRNTDTKLLSALTSEINSVFGVGSPRDLADYVMFCLPPGSFNGIAYAYINSWNSIYNDDWCDYLSTQMHEVGHNLGYGHSNENGGYNDKTGMMGYSYDSDNGPTMCFNAAKSWQTGWYATKSEVVDPSAGDCFEDDIHGITDFDDGDANVVLVKINDSSSTDFFVNFNRQDGINSGTEEGGDQVTVVRQGADGNSYAESELMAKLGQGEKWTSNIDNKSMTVEVLRIGALGGSVMSASVRISQTGASCGPVVPVPTGSPTPVPTRNPTNPPVPTTPTPTPLPTTGSPTRGTTPQPTTCVAKWDFAPGGCSSQGTNDACCSKLCWKNGRNNNLCR